MEIKVKKLTETAKLPTKAHSTDACFDLYADEPERDEIYIPAQHSVTIHTGISTEIPQGYFAAVYPRSGLGVKQNLRLANTTGVIDADYRGEWLVALYNDSSEGYRIIKNGDRIAQFAILPVPEVTLVEAEELTSTERGQGGFGSSGKN